jgi:hypothetical protein
VILYLTKALKDWKMFVRVVMDGTQWDMLGKITTIINIHTTSTISLIIHISRVL